MRLVLVGRPGFPRTVSQAEALAGLLYGNDANSTRWSSSTCVTTRS